ncbi:MAG: ABC transporter permease [Bacteroidales bacterium]|nr:ABC transporter permease [Bacteroidales bacterium]
MNFRNIGIIISREYSTRVHKKSFLFITFGVPLLFIVFIGVVMLILTKSSDKMQTVGVVDESGIVMPYLSSGKSVTYVDRSDYDLDDLKSGLKDDEADIVLHISPLDTVAKSVSVEVFSLKPTTVDFVERVQSKVEDAVEDYRIASYGIPDLKEVVANLKPDIRIATYTINEEGDEKATSSDVFMVISIILTLIIFMFISMFSSMVMQGVIEEKSSKVVEVLTSSVKSTELMFGKIIGVAGVALTQFLLWVAVIGIVVLALAKFGVFSSLTGAEATEQITQMTSMPGMDMSSMTGIDPTQIAGAAGTAADEAAVEDNSELAAVLETLKGLNYGQIILSFIVYFLLGYLLYASLFGAVGSAVDNEADTSQLQMPLTIPLLIAFYIAFYVFRTPDSAVAVWGSIIPFTSPIVMLARIPFGVPGWQLALSIVLLFLTFVFCAWLSAKIYRVGILTSGKKSTFKDLWKWLRMK